MDWRLVATGMAGGHEHSRAMFPAAAAQASEAVLRRILRGGTQARANFQAITVR